MTDTKKVRMMRSRGNPSTGAILQAGATIEISSFWADKWIADGSAVLIETEPPPAKPKGKKNGK